MKIGYLHLGPPRHGIYRYGRLLASEAHRCSELSVLEAEVLLSENPTVAPEKLIAAAKQLTQADLIHIQYSKFNDRLWGADWTQRDNLRIFLDHCNCPIVVTLHDVFYVPFGLKGIFQQVLPAVFPAQCSGTPQPPDATVSSAKKVVRSIKGWWMNTFGAATATLSELAERSQLILVCSQEEARRLGDRIDPHKLSIIPHFVEPRSVKMTGAEARVSLNLTDKPVVTLLGFIYPYKGHQLVVEAMSYLPDNVQVIFAGGADADQQFVHMLWALAKERGVEHRLHITGYLGEDELERYLAATDLALCPFTEFSASGSVSTWISVARPILASNLPQFREYNSLEPGAIALFEPYTPQALAAAIQKYLTQDKAAQSAIARLQQQLSLPVLFQQHLAHYRRCLLPQQSRKVLAS